MRFIKGLAPLFLSCLATCAVTERTYPLPQIAETDKQQRILCIGEVSLFEDAKFKCPLKDSHPLADRAESGKQEARVTLCDKLEEQGFRVWPNHEEGDRGGVHLAMDLGLRSEFFRFFLIARIRGYSDSGYELFQFLVETEVFGGKESEVRRAGRHLAEKIAQGLKEVLAKRPQ